MASLGSLVADLKLNSAAFVKGLDKAQASAKADAAKIRRELRAVEKQAKRTAKSFDQLKVGIGAVAGALAVRQFATFAKQSLEFADNIAKSADSIGLSTQAFQQYTIAADMAGLEQRKLQRGLIGFNKLIGELRAGQGTLFTFLNKTNKSLAEQLKGIETTEEGLGIFLKALSNTANAQDRMALAAAGFTARAGANMLILIKDGVESMDDLIAKFKEWGLIMRDDTLRAAERIKDNIGLLQRAFEVGFSTSIIEAMNGEIGRTADQLQEANRIGRQLGEFVGKAIKFLIAATRTLAEHWETLVSIMAGFVAMKVGGVILGMVGAMISLATHIGKASAKMAILNKVMRANLFGIIATAIGVVVGLLIEYKDHVIEIGDTTFTVGELIVGAWESIKVAILNHINVLITAVKAAWTLVSNAFDDGWAKANKVMDEGLAENAKRHQKLKDLWSETFMTKEERDFLTGNLSADPVGRPAAEEAAATGGLGSGPSTVSPLKTGKSDAEKAQDFRKKMMDDLKAESKNLIELQQALSISSEAYDKQSAAIEVLEAIRKSGHKLTQDEIGEILRRTEAVRMSQKAFEDFKHAKETTDDLKLEIKWQKELLEARKEGLDVFEEFEIRKRIELNLMKDGRAATQEQIDAWVRMEQQLAGVNKELNDYVKAQEDIKSLTERMLTPMEQYNKRIQELKKLLDSGLSVETYNRAVKKAGEDLDEALDKTDKVGEAAKELGMTFSSAFEDAIAGGKGLSEILNGLEQDIIRIVTRKLVTEPLTDWITDTIKTMGGPTAGQAGTAQNQIPTGANMTAGRTGPAFPQLPPWIQPTVPMGASFESMSGPEVFDMSTLFNTGQAPGVGFDIGALFNTDPGGFDIGGMMSGFMGPIMGGLSSMLGGMFGGGGGMMGGGGPMGMLGMLGSQMGGSFLQNFSPLASLISGEGLFSFLGFADGGRPPPGKFSVVGEKGPELFMPDTAGTVLPNDVLQGMGNKETQNFQIPVTIVANDPNAFRESEGQIASSMAVALQRARMRNL